MTGKRKLPPVPAGIDATSADIVPLLLTGYVGALPDGYDLHRESLAFRDLLEATHPAAWKQYTDQHWTAHFYERMRAEINRQRSEARRATRTATATARITRSVTEISHSVDNHGEFKRLMAMTRLDLAVIEHRYESTARTSLIHARFYKRLRARLKTDTEVVGDRWKVTEIEDLKVEVYGDTDAPEVP